MQFPWFEHPSPLLFAWVTAAGPSLHDGIVLAVNTHSTVGYTEHGAVVPNC